jgi:hypothetical protein
MSGKASIGSFDREYPPQIINATVNNPIMSLFLME